MSILESYCSYPLIIHRYMKYVTLFCLMYLFCPSPTLFLCDDPSRFLSPELANAFYHAVYEGYRMLNLLINPKLLYDLQW